MAEDERKRSVRLSSVTNFLRAARQRSQADIIKHFLRLVVKTSKIAESGSVLIFDPCENRLNLFNNDNFLFEEGFLDKNEKWRLSFKANEGIAGLAFTTREKQIINDTSQDQNFVSEGGEAIATIICVPIWVADQEEPFGIVSFHNSDPAAIFDEALVDIAEMAVQCLGMALDAASGRLTSKSKPAIFIVHGHNKTPLFWLQGYLRERQIDHFVLGDQERAGEDLLDMLEEGIGRCNAGFVLLTADDEGRMIGQPNRPPEALQSRARQNVIFEAGMLCARFRRQRRVCFVKCGDIEIPSDVKGLFFEEFDANNPPETRFDRVLRGWGYDWPRPGR